VIVYSNIVILDNLQQSSLPLVKVRMCEDILQTLMIRIEFTSLSHQVVSPNPESVNHNS
jgi:hypothetical protein